MAATSANPKVAVIVGSQRVARAGAQIAQMVLNTIKETNPPVELTLIDLATRDLPLFKEATIPAYIKSADGYSQDIVKKWSAEIASYAGYVFVTPEYNCSIPASLKSAIDHLYNEWVGKPGLIVSYGSNGGDTAAAHLKMILGALQIKPVDKKVAMKFPSREFTGKAATGQPLELEEGAGKEVWAEERKEIKEAFSKFLESLNDKAIS